MDDPKSLTLIQYYKNFKSVSGALAAATGIAPLASALLPNGGVYLFPPLGESTNTARFGVAILAVAVTYIAFYKTKPTGSIFRGLLFLVLVSSICLCVYLWCFRTFVRKLDIPASASAVFVSVGFERTEFATHTFGSATDWEMLRERGTSEEEVSRLWTSSSIDIAHLALVGSYVGFVLPLVLVFSLGVRYQT